MEGESIGMQFSRMRSEKRVELEHEGWTDTEIREYLNSHIVPRLMGHIDVAEQLHIHDNGVDTRWDVADTEGKTPKAYEAEIAVVARLEANQRRFHRDS